MPLASQADVLGVREAFQRSARISYTTRQRVHCYWNRPQIAKVYSSEYTEVPKPFFFLDFSMGWDYVSELLSLTDILFIAQMIYGYRELRWNDTDRGKPKTRRKTCLSATLSTTNPTRIDPVVNLGLRGERSATNRVSRGTRRRFLRHTRAPKRINEQQLK
jgi:hypothetical protein